MKKSKLLWMLAVLTICASCSIQKRHYRGGYTINWKKIHSATSGNPRSGNCEAQKSTEKYVYLVVPASQSVKNVLTASASKFFLPAQKMHRTVPSAKDSCGDVIMMRNGDEVLVSVIEVGLETIRYRRCDNFNGPVFVVRKGEVFKITYASGITEVFPLETKAMSTKIADKVPVVRKTNGFALAAFICTCLFILIIPLAFAFIFGLIALIQMHRNPEKYKGKWMAIVGITPGLLAILILLIGLMSIFFP